MSFQGDRPRPSATTVFLQVAVGFALTFVLHGVVGFTLFLVGTLVPLVNTAASMWLMGLGVAQFVYILPTALALAFVRRPLALGMSIGAAITFLLQGACYGFFLVVGQGFH